MLTWNTQADSFSSNFVSIPTISIASLVPYRLKGFRKETTKKLKVSEMRGEMWRKTEAATCKRCRHSLVFARSLAPLCSSRPSPFPIIYPITWSPLFLFQWLITLTTDWGWEEDVSPKYGKTTWKLSGRVSFFRLLLPQSSLAIWKVRKRKKKRKRWDLECHCNQGKSWWICGKKAEKSWHWEGPVGTYIGIQFPILTGLESANIYSRNEWNYSCSVTSFSSMVS